MASASLIWVSGLVSRWSSVLTRHHMAAVFIVSAPPFKLARTLMFKLGKLVLTDLLYSDSDKISTGKYALTFPVRFILFLA